MAAVAQSVDIPDDRVQLILIGVLRAGGKIGELGLAITLEATHEEIEATIHAHPTLSEAVHEATGQAYGVAIHL